LAEPRAFVAFCEGFFLSSAKPFLFLFFGPGFSVDYIQGLLSVLDFSMKLERAMHKENMQVT